MRGEHLIGHPQPVEMKRTLRRDELAAKFCPRKFLLLSQQHARAAHCQVNRRAGAGGTAAGDDDVIVERTNHVMD